MDLALHNLWWLICHKPNSTKFYIFDIYREKEIGFGIKQPTMIDMPQNQA